MEIKSNIIKHYLSNCYFITGTAYAGKSTMCKALAEKYNLYHCEENYNSDTIFNVIDIEDQPNLSYFKTKESWEEFLNRTPEDYESWLIGNNREIIGFEIAELIRLSSNQKVIVDTNIPIELLEEIADDNQVAIMLSPPEISSSRFFDRDDPEKKFLLEQINLCANPDSTYQNFTACIEKFNRTDYKKFTQSKFFTINRGFEDWTSKEETTEILGKHFGFTSNNKI
ncbi:MAG: AAA family ATPase [Clostridiales bacterium]|nr:AAA family ATPase [Clostridiales bacterium]